MSSCLLSKDRPKIQSYEGKRKKQYQQPKVTILAQKHLRTQAKKDADNVQVSMRSWLSLTSKYANPVYNVLIKNSFLGGSPLVFSALRKSRAGQGPMELLKCASGLDDSERGRPLPLSHSHLWQKQVTECCELSAWNMDGLLHFYKCMQGCMCTDKFYF